MSDPRLTNPLAGIQAEQIADPQPNAPLSPPSWLEQLPDNDNPFAARLRADPSIGNSGPGGPGGPGLGERLSLNADEGFYRGSLRGIAKLNTLEGIANGQSPPEGLYAGVPNPEYAGMTPQDARAEADRIRLRLAQYETMPGFSGPLEGTAALAGQIGGGLLSPESWITKFPGVRWAIGKVAGEAADTVAGRIVDAALSQGMVQATVDPLVQAGAISANLQDGYDPIRTAEAFGVGLATGGLLHGGAEALGAITEPLRTARERLADQEAFAPTAGRIARERFAPPQPAQPAQAAPVGSEINWLRVEDPSFQSFPTTGAPAPLATAAAADEAAIEAARQRAAGIPVEEGAPTPTAEAPLTGQTTVLAAEPTRQFPTIPDPLDLMQSGELTADRAEEIRDQIQTHFDTAENEIFGPEDAAKLRQLHRQSNAAWESANDARAKELDAQIDEIESRASPEDLAHVEGRGAGDAVDPEMWGVITRNLREAEADREGGVAVVADQIRYLPSGGAPKTISEREAIAVIGRAMQAEAERGGDIPKFLDDAFKERFERYGGGADARELVDDQKDRLLALMRNERAPAVTPPAPALPAPAPAPLEGGIVGDVARQFIAAGRPEAEARGLGALQQTLYENLAARFEGRLGTAEDIYRREGAQIVAGEDGELQPGELGQRQRTVEVGGHELPLNPDGTVTLYHATKTPEAAERVASQRTLRSGGEPSVYLSTAAEGTGYGDHVIAVNVDPALLRIDDEFPNGRADFAIDKRSVKVAAAKRMPSGPLTPEEHALTALPIFEPDFPVQPVRSRTVETIAADLQERGRQALRALGIRTGIIRGPSPHTDELLSRAIAAEVQGAAQREGRALDWYTGRVAEALRVAALIHPELATDANARMAYTAALAITSQGENVRSNVRLTDIAYTYFKEHGRFPTDMSVAEPIPINGNFAKFNRYLEQLGPDGLREFLHRQYTVRELEAETGHKVGGLHKDNVVNGSVIFGPKIGQGFFQNLNGNFNPITIDLWFMRAWGRLTGNLVGASEATQAAQRATFVDALQAANQRAPQTLPALERRAQAILSEHEQNFRRYRAEYDAGTRTKSALVNAAERFVLGRHGIIEQPQSGAVRNWIAARVERARELLAQEGGLNITNADLQALWWYPEKSVYERMGGQPADAINLDYGTAHQELARQKGISDESISRAVGAVDRRPRPAAAGDVGGAVEGERGGGGAVAGEGAQAEPGTAGGGEPGGGTTAELAPAAGAITFEVAPDPRNPALVARWGAIPQAVREQISHSTAGRIVSRALDGAGEALWGAGERLEGKLQRNNGAWLNDPNPSLTLELDQGVAPAKAGALSRLLGYALRQAEVLRTSPRPFPGGAETGTVIVSLPKDATPADIHAVWQQIREIKDGGGNPYALGHTTGPDGDMVILNNNDRAATISTPELAKLINDKLGDRFNIRNDTLYAERVQAGNNDYALPGTDEARPVREGAPEPSLRQAGDNLRREAQQHIEEQLRAHEASTGGARGEAAGELEQAGRARIRLATDDANALVTLVRNAADASSGIHELAHDWLERLVRDAANPEAPREFVDDVNKILRPWLGNDGGAITTAQHEKFATAWEQYMRSGRAPTRQLEGIFAQFREWLLQIYQTLTGLGEPLTPEMQGFFDRLHAIPEKRAASEGRLAEGLVGEPVPNMQPHRVATAGGDSVEVTPIVVEARDLVASNDAGYDASLQPRQRDRAASQQQVREMASRLDPERLGASSEADRGAPIIGDDGMVESGNGRVMAIRAAYDADGPAVAAYREWLGKQGVDVSGYDQPVLVRQRTTAMSPDERQAFARDANRAATLELSAPERAMSDARNLTPDMLDLIRNPDNLEAVQNRDFVRAFVESLPQAEQGAMTTAEGGLSSQGAARIRHAILARAYGGTPDGAAILSRITEATQDEIRSISTALTAATPQWARLRGDIETGHVVPEVDLTPELLDAVRRTADLRNRGQSFADFLRQRDAFDVLPPRVEAFMSLFYDARGTRAAGAQHITGALRDYANEASKVSAERGLDLGLAPVTADDIQRRIVERARGGGADTGTANLFGRERPDLVAGGAGAGADGAVGGAEGQRPGVAESGAGAGTAGEPGAGSGAGVAGSERPAVEPSAAAPTATGVSGRVPVRGTPSPATGGAAAGAEGAIRTLHQQAFDLADALNFPLRQGRMAKPAFVGQYDNAQDVVRQRAVADFETIAHEAGHAIEKHVGPELTALTNRFASELAPLDYDLNLQRVNEGFAEWLRHYLTSPPGYAETLAPGFAAEFRDFMTAKNPTIMAELDRARAAYQAYQHAPTGEKLDAIVQRSEPETVIGTIRKEGMARSVSMVLSHAYQGIFDDKAPVTKAVRDLSRLYREASGGKLLNLQGSDNPELLVRMFARAHQAAVRDMLDGVRPYHAIEPQGPSLRDALIKATGKPGIFGRWDDEALKEFSNYLVARRGEVLWNKYDAGQLARRPLAMSKTEVADAIAEAEKKNPTFRDGAQMVHDYTRQILRKQYEAGLIDRELYDKLTAEPFYVPLYRNMEDKPMLGASDRPTAGGAQGPGTVDLIKRQTGSDRDIIDPIQGLMTQSFLVERAVAHNDIIKSFVALAKQAKDAGATGVGRILETVPAHEIRAQKFNLAEGIKNAADKAGIDPDDAKLLLGAVSDTFGDDPIMASIFRKERTEPRGEPILFYKDGGELKAVRLIADAEGRALYESLAGLPPVIHDWAVQFGAASASMLRSGIVLNPVFAITNFVRDQIAASILRPGYIPFNPRGIFREIRGDRYAQMYTAAGGVSPGAGAVGLQDMLVDRSVEALARKGYFVQKLAGLGELLTRGNLKEGAKTIGEFVETAETGTRLNVMKQVFDQKKAQGLNDYDAMLEAAYAATDLLDFGRHGSGTAVIRTLVPFINAHMQALSKASRTLFVPLWRAARGDLVTQGEVDAVKNAALGWGLIGISTGLGAAYATWGQHHEAYRDANDELRATHLIIPGDAFGYPGKILLIPKPFELAIGFNLGEMLGLGLATGDPRIGTFARDGVQEVLMPPNLLNSIPILKNYAELTLNKSFFTGRPIVPDSIAALAPAEQYGPNTSRLARIIGRAINVSPIKVDYAIGNTFGLWGKDVLALSNTTDPDAPAAALEDQMFLRRFIKGADAASETTKRFWNLAAQQNGEYAQAKTTYEFMLHQFRDKDAAAFLAALPISERAYVTLQSSADEDGKPVFSGDDKRLNPLTRAATAVLTNNALIRDLQTNVQTGLESGERFNLDPQHRRDIIDNLRILSAMEQRNALVMTGEPAYAGRKLLSTEDQYKVIQAISPQVGEEVAARYATAKIAPTETVARLWPEAQKRLLADGSEAELRELSYDALADGAAFEGDRVKKAPKRRLPIAPAPPGPTLQPPPG